jgi:phage tail-like protein
MSFSLGGALNTVESGLKTLENLAVEPYKAYNFRVILHPDLKSGGLLNSIATGLLASLALGSFATVEGIGWNTEVHTVREGGVNDREHKLPGRTTCNELQFTKGLTLLDPMWEWYHFTVKGKVKRMNGTIFLMSDMHTPSVGQKVGPLPSVKLAPSIALPTAAWNFYGAFPSKLEGVHFDASQSALAVQRMTLSIDRIEKFGLSSFF